MERPTGRDLLRRRVRSEIDARHRAALGADAFDLILDGLTDNQVKSLVTRVDKHHPELKTASPEWRLQ
jgi:hypothetical protein